MRIEEEVINYKFTRWLWLFTFSFLISGLLPKLLLHVQWELIRIVFRPFCFPLGLLVFLFFLSILIFPPVTELVDNAGQVGPVFPRYFKRARGPERLQMWGNCEKSLGLLRNVLREETQLLDWEYKAIQVATASGGPVLRWGKILG